MSLSPLPMPGEVRTVPDKLDEILDRLERIEASQVNTASLVSQFIDGIKPTIEEALPKIQAIAESSWFRMISGGKKR